MFQTVVVKKMKTLFMCSNFFTPKILPFMGKCGKIWLMWSVQMTLSFACWIIKATNTHSEYVILNFCTATVVTRTRLNVTFIVPSDCFYSCMDVLLLWAGNFARPDGSASFVVGMLRIFAMKIKKKNCVLLVFLIYWTLQLSSVQRRALCHVFFFWSFLFRLF